MAERHHEHHDPTVYRSPRDAAAAPPERLAYVATFSRPADEPDAIAVVNVDPQGTGYGYQRPRCTTSPNGRRSGTRTGASGRPAG